MKQLLILLTLVCTPVFSADFPSKATLEANTKQALEKLIPTYRTKAIKDLEAATYDNTVVKSAGLVNILVSYLDERENQSYAVDIVEVKDELSSTYVSWFHTSDAQKAKDIYFKISSTGTTYEYNCSILYTETSFHVAGCDISKDGTLLNLEGITYQERCMEPILPLYTGKILNVYIDEQLDPLLTASKD